MTTSRRTFLKQSAGGALVLGLPQLLSGSCGLGRGPWEEALARMKENGLHGVAIAIPDDAPGRKKLGKALEVFVTFPLHKALRTLALEAVYVCVDGKKLTLGDAENVALLDPTGKQRAAARIDWSTPENIARGLRGLLNDADRRAARVDAASTKAIRDDVAELAEANYVPAWQRLHASWRRAMPLVLATLDDPKATRLHKERLSQFTNSIAHAVKLDKNPTLPFGVSWKITKKGFEPEPCPPCGMALPRPPVRKFLRFRRG